jgi:hypothetical protein
MWASTGLNIPTSVALLVAAHMASLGLSPIIVACGISNILGSHWSLGSPFTASNFVLLGAACRSPYLVTNCLASQAFLWSLCGSLHDPQDDLSAKPTSWGQYKVCCQLKTRQTPEATATKASKCLGIWAQRSTSLSVLMPISHPEVLFSDNSLSNELMIPCSSVSPWTEFGQFLKCFEGNLSIVLMQTT